MEDTPLGNLKGKVDHAVLRWLALLPNGAIFFNANDWDFLRLFHRNGAGGDVNMKGNTVSAGFPACAGGNDHDELTECAGRNDHNDFD